MDKRLISFDPLSGMKTFHAYDDLTDTSTFIYEGNATTSLELNKLRANDTDLTRKGIKDEWWLYASIDPIVQMKWLTEYGIDIWNKEHAGRVSQLLEDPEWRYLKCTGKRHIMKA